MVHEPDLEHGTVTRVRPRSLIRLRGRRGLIRVVHRERDWLLGYDQSEREILWATLRQVDYVAVEAAPVERAAVKDEAPPSRVDRVRTRDDHLIWPHDWVEATAPGLIVGQGGLGQVMTLTWQGAVPFLTVRGAGRQGVTTVPLAEVRLVLADADLPTIDRPAEHPERTRKDAYCCVVCGAPTTLVGRVCARHHVSGSRTKRCPMSGRSVDVAQGKAVETDPAPERRGRSSWVVGGGATQEA